jgi:SAM-dependent MidA family methyltransferase
VSIRAICGKNFAKRRHFHKIKIKICGNSRNLRQNQAARLEKSTANPRPAKKVANLFKLRELCTPNTLFMSLVRKKVHFCGKNAVQ